jgi:flagellar assembly protein FliH
MMSSSFSEKVTPTTTVPITSFQYREIGTPAFAPGREKSQGEPGGEIVHEEGPLGLSAEETSDLVTRTRLEAVAETETRLKKGLEAKAEAEAVKIRRALERFQAERKNYFSRVEAEVVQLALAIAAKILHREAQVDPMLVAALVRVAIDKLHDGSRVSVRVCPAEADKWREYLANPLNGSTVEIIEDAHLGAADCILETDLGSANFSIDAQLKEVEQGFFDLLALRPAVK